MVKMCAVSRLERQFATLYQNSRRLWRSQRRKPRSVPEGGADFPAAIFLAGNSPNLGRDSISCRRKIGAGFSSSVEICRKTFPAANFGQPQPSRVFLTKTNSASKMQLDILQNSTLVTCTWVKPGRFGSFFVLCFLALGGHCLQMLCLPGFGTHPNTQNLPHFRAFPASIHEHSPPKCLFRMANAKLPNRPGFALLHWWPPNLHFLHIGTQEDQAFQMLIEV